ncbi:hypothetical protein [Bacillus vallismortis]|uniref:hypothetical protein n=1 Tax=Bacillus vallismortis TaxID=72361 RepID=UPI0020905499|nr:hypothetical protein [Bacillus vallismortis]MCO4849955.1 hypothetical protein [Bacillus vallismortis]
MELNLSYMSISELLEKAAEKNEIIYTRRNQRRLGKTTALIQFARENNSPILMIPDVAHTYQKEHPDLTFIDYKDEIALDGLTNIVCDEGVPLKVIERLHGLGQLLTGFVIENEMVPVYLTKSLFQPKPSPLLQIELDEIDSVPRVFYKGEKITNRIAVDFEWRTRESDKVGSAYIHLKYGKEIDGMLAVDTKEIAFGERAYR